MIVESVFWKTNFLYQLSPQSDIPKKKKGFIWLLRPFNYYKNKQYNTNSDNVRVTGCSYVRETPIPRCGGNNNDIKMRISLARSTRFSVLPGLC